MRRGIETASVATVLVDTNVATYIAQGNERGRRYWAALVGCDLALPFPVVGELLMNTARAGDPEKAVQYWEGEFENYLFVEADPATCRVWASLNAVSKRQGRPRGTNDLWIASCALRWDLPLVTHNLAHFEDIPGLRIIHHPDP